MSAQPSYIPFSARDARVARQSYQHLAHIINRIINRIMQGLSEQDAKAFKPTVFATIHSLHGFFNGQPEKNFPLIKAHKFVAPHFDYHGDPENAARFMDRRLDALAVAEATCGRRFVSIVRADNKTLLFTSYEGHPLLDAAERLYLRARSEANYWKNPSAAITDELLDKAISELPEAAPLPATATGDADATDEGGADLADDWLLKGRWTREINNIERILIDESKTGADPVLKARTYAEKIVNLGKAIKERYERERLRAAASMGDEDAADDRGAISEALTDTHAAPIDDVHDGKTVLPKNGEVEAAPVAPTHDIFVVGTESQVEEINDLQGSPGATSETSMLDWALLWASRGVPVFPVHSITAAGVCDCRAGANCKSAGKHPHTANGLDSATTDEKAVREMWRRWPGANIGGRTGDGLLVVDVDPKHGGDASLCDLMEAHGNEWLNTLTVRTGSGGSHFFFNYSPELDLKNTANKLAPGIDSRAGRGYVVLPPSMHVSGNRYTLVNLTSRGELPVQRDADAWLLEDLTRPRDVQPTKVINFQERRPRAGAGGIIPEGERNDTIFRVGCAIWGKGEAEGAADLHMQLLEVNATRCTPALTDAEVAQIVGSVMRYPRGVPVPVAAKRTET